MRTKFFTVAAVLAGSALMSAYGASASVITAGACVPGTLATPCPGVQIGAAGAPPSFTLNSTPVGNFTISGGAIAGVTATGATFNTQTIAVSTTVGGLIDVYFTISDVPTQQLPLQFTSTFTSNQQNATTHEVIESTYLDNANGIFTTPAGGLLASADLTSAVLETAGPTFTTKTPGANVSFTELYQIQLQSPGGCGAQPGGICTANLTIDLSAAEVPEPASLAIFGTALLGLGGLGVIRRRRRGNQS